MTDPAPGGAGAPRRRPYLDWLRGAGVLIMIEGHTLDAWTRLDERTRAGYQWAIAVAGIGAPIFLFLAGAALALAAGSRQRAGLDDAAVAARASRRALGIFGLAFLFRFQSWVISRGEFWSVLLKVDILNVMGLSLLAAALLWAAGRDRRSRALLLSACAALVALATPIVRASPLLAALPDPVEWYLRPVPGRNTFTLFPWSGFLLAGGAVGLWLDAAREPDTERRAMAWLALAGAALALGGYGASYLPPIYRDVSFWTSSPTFFFLRLGIVMAAVPAAYAWMRAWPGWSPLRELGVASLFVYWIHVELVYGVPSLMLHRRLRFEQALAALAIVVILMFGAVRLRDRIVRGLRPVLAGATDTRSVSRVGSTRTHRTP
ncbi:MAG TPA: heparan-alpha-glucosaminide N-acetyltransferase domain-containing protein [Vicinamibacterales bacterium]|nr:heparan-alpha-glucosaminide N-acetyltransferase domain-containing protein [Vicinamibacterales bacterium]